MNQAFLSNGTIRLACRWSDESLPLAAALRRFLSPWFSEQQGTQADLELTLLPAAAFPADARARCVTPAVIRRSTADIFNLEVRRGRLPAGELAAWDEARQVGYLVDPMAPHVHFFGSLETGFIHLIELVRYYGLLVEQSRGTLVLHASAVVGRGSHEVVGIVGAKAAGKTTTMLAMLATREYDYFSGDKLLLRVEDGELRVRGWPDYPHVGIGTLGAHPGLARNLGVPLHAADGSPRPSAHKVLVPPAEFLQAIGGVGSASGRLSLLVLPDVGERTRKGQVALDGGEKERIGPVDLFEWPHRFETARWHGLPLTREPHADQVPRASWEALKRIPWIRKFGTGTHSRPLEYS